ncbi:hypothetical protein R1flu_014190 [Riccia fluitans]|uniref:UmuC domain-containing protein n=1 Tax=Riccia fluitans TaxID=41844 RepID=A0ABD1YGH2_9MARC
MGTLLVSHDDHAAFSSLEQDIDCFYAQSETLRCPALRGRPVGVTQKTLVVTANYVARNLGVPKMASIEEARKVLPALVLVNGEDLTPYRAESKQIMAVLGRYGVVQRSGLDEGAVDISAQVRTRLQCGAPALSFSGHIIGWATVEASAENLPRGSLINFATRNLSYNKLSALDKSLLVGSQIVSEMRSAIERETGFHCSCGVAQNKMLAKLSSSLNKPDKQTCLLSDAVESFIAPLHVRKIPGVGHQTELILGDMGVKTIADLRTFKLSQLSERLGARIGQFLYDACRGQDFSPVVDRGPPKSITVEDSFKSCRSLKHAEGILRILAPDLIKRLDEDREETGRRPRTLTLKWRLSWTKGNFGSVSSDLPVELLSSSMSTERRSAVAVDVALKMLVRSLGKEFEIVVLNIGATNFLETAAGSPGLRDIRSFLQVQDNSPRKILKVTSKNDARVRRESYKKAGSEIANSAVGDKLGLSVFVKADRVKPSETDVFASGHIGDDHQQLSSNDEDEEWKDWAVEVRSAVRTNGSIASNYWQSQASTGVFQLEHSRSNDLPHKTSLRRTPQVLSEAVRSGEPAENNCGGEVDCSDSQLATSSGMRGLQCQTQTDGSSGNTPLIRKDIHPESYSPKTKRKSRNGTLDAFVIRKFGP